jgi:sensor histidine kinase YesM
MRHPILSDRVRLAVWWLVWFLLGLGQSILFYFAYGSFINISITDSILSLLIYSGIALSLWYPFRFFNTGPNKTVVLISDLVVTGAISVAIWIILTRFLITTIFQADINYQTYWDATFSYRLGSGVFLYCLTIMTYYLFVNINRLSEKNAREARLESLIKETELKMLRSQINPHFLFNSLNSISSLTVTDPEKARNMVIKLSDFLRYSLSEKEERPVSLRSELENLRLYLDIEKVRFGDRLVTEEYIDDECLKVRIPVMLLQPLYENAIKHGVYESTETVRIITRASMSDGILELSVSNNYESVSGSVKGTSTGLMNVTRRLELNYGNKSSLKILKENGIFTAMIFIPAREPFDHE